MIISSMEPMLPASDNRVLSDLTLELVAVANQFSGKLHPQVQRSLADLVRSMNCYYSNLIEGHNTHPRDIDRAMAAQYSSDPARLTSQLEARAHIEVQQLIDSGQDPKVSTTSSEYLRWIHFQFCSRLPEELLTTQHPDTGDIMTVIPGEFRTNWVQVGSHIPPSADELVQYMSRFEQAYDTQRLSRSQGIIGVAAAHHRFVWIHPFLDGNGRVARLMSHASLLRMGLGGSLWSIARGLARSGQHYKAKLQAADLPRQSSFDGRGALSEKHLAAFCEYFLSMSIDQVTFMESLLQPGELLRRMQLYCDDEISAGRLPKRSMALLREALIMGQFERRDAPEITGYQERKAREVLSVLLKKGLLISEGPRKPVRLGFPIDVVERWFPALYPVG